MEDEYVVPSVARLLKEKGFNFVTKSVFLFVKDEYKITSGDMVRDGYDKDQYPMPTLSVAQKWLREVKKIDVIPYTTLAGGYENKYVVDTLEMIGKQDNIHIPFEPFYRYEAALQYGIYHALKTL